MDETTRPLTPMSFDGSFILCNRQTGEPLQNVRYVVHLDDGSKVEGVTDEHGRSALIVSDKEGPARVVFFSENPSN